MTTSDKRVAPTISGCFRRGHQQQHLLLKEMTMKEDGKTNDSTSSSKDSGDTTSVYGTTTEAASSSEDDDDLHQQQEEQQQVKQEPTSNKKRPVFRHRHNASKKARTLSQHHTQQQQQGSSSNNSSTSQRVLRRPRVVSLSSNSDSAAAGDFGDDDGKYHGFEDIISNTAGSKRSRETLPDIAKRIPVDALRPYLRMPLLRAAKELSISATTLKRLCRLYGIKRWPFRQISGIDRTVTRLEAELELSINRVPSADMADSIAEHIQQLNAHRQSIIKVALEGGHEPIRGKLASVGVFVNTIQSNREAGAANNLPIVQQQQQQQQMEHQVHLHQQHSAQSSSSSSSSSSSFSSSPFLEGGGGGGSNADAGNDTVGALSVPPLAHVQEQQPECNVALQAAAFMVPGPPTSDAFGDEYCGSRVSSALPPVQQQARGVSSTFSYHPRHYSNPHLNHYTQPLNSFLDECEDVPIVEPGATATTDGGGGGDATSSSLSSTPTTAEVVAAAAAAVAAKVDEAVAADQNKNDSNTRSSTNLYSGQPRQPVSPCTVVRPTGRDLSAGATGEYDFGGRKGDHRQAQQQHHHQLPQLLPYFTTSSGMDTTTTTATDDGHGGGGVTTPTRGWNVVPATPQGGEKYRGHTAFQEKQYHQHCQYVQRQFYGRVADDARYRDNENATKYEAPPLLRQQQQQPEWSQQHSGGGSSSSGDFGGGARNSSTSMLPSSQSQSEFLMAAAAAVTSAAAPVQFAGRSRHGPKASIDIALDQVSTLGELVLGNYNLYPDATSYDAIDMMDSSNPSGGGYGNVNMAEEQQPEQK